MENSTPPAGGFHVNRKKHFLTWSCPVDADENPISSKEVLLDALKERGEIDRYSIGKELHENGKTHYHAYIECDINSHDCRLFDIVGVHPNWAKGVFARHVKYSQKFGDFISEGCDPKVNHFKEASKKRTAEEAIDYLWDNEPKSMCVNGHNIERNLKRKLNAGKHFGRVYYGPYRFVPPADWDRDSQTLVVTGTQGIGKTQWAKQYCLHEDGEFFYCKRSPTCLKHYKGEKWIIYDDIEVEHFQKLGWNNWACMFDVADGDQVMGPGIRIDADYQIPPGVKKIWLRNAEQERLLDRVNQVFHNNRRSYCVDYVV